MEEEWRWIEGQEGKYQISNKGRIRSFVGRETRILLGTPDRRGYICVGLWDKRTPRKIYTRMHQLVAKAFVPNPLELKEVNHDDEDKGNNFASNLKWVTRRENCLHSRLRPPTMKGEKHGMAKITDDDVLTIRQRYRRGSPDNNLTVIANEYGISVSTVHHIIQRQNWKHI